jgi:hypothetical protein
MEGVRQAGGARYAALVSGDGILFESALPGEDVVFLRHHLRERIASLLALPGQLQGAGPEDDLFDGFEGDAFLVTVINGRVALVLACPDAEAARTGIEPPLLVLADRLFRYEPRFRVDEQGRGLFFGRPRLDSVVVGRADG